MNAGTRRWLCAALLMTLMSAAIAAQEDAPDGDVPGRKIIDRAERDAVKLLPQTGLWGDDDARLTPHKTTFKTVAIEVEGCEKMEGYISLPENLDKDAKYALFFMFHGNGDRGDNRVKNLARITSERDPIITIGVQYQELTPEGKGEMGLPTLASSEKIIEGCRWLLGKVIEDHPVDTERVFVGGFSWGTTWASSWARAEWENAPDSFPFRAVFLYSSGGAVRRENCPPCPWVLFVGENETAVLGRINVVRSVRQFGNTLKSWGVPTMYHEIPGMGHATNNRVKQITRDVINALGGPGVTDYGGDDPFKAEPLPFKKSDDPYVREVVGLCESDDWAGALERVEEIAGDRDIPRKEKRAVRNFDRDIVKVARDVVRDVHGEIESAIDDGKMPNPALIARLRAICETFADETWISNRDYNDTLEFLDTDFPPVARERERAEMMRQAAELEAAEGKRAEARKLYEELAARKDEDDGRSIWPRAAEYRLMWWVDE